MDGFFYSCAVGFFSILTNELGDRTFLLTALFCSQKSFWKVFPMCMSALLLNCIVSVAFGRFLLPFLFNDIYIKAVSSLILFISGLWMVWKALRDLITELEDDPEFHDTEESKHLDHEVSVFRIFAIIFVAELGDRSQLATFALSTTHNFWGILIGTICGHFISSLSACLAGSALSQKVSMPILNLIGGILFIFLAVLPIIIAD